MKFQKLDSKQTPQVVILVVLVIGVFGWAGYSAISGAAPPKKKPTVAADTATVQVAKAPSDVSTPVDGAAGGPADAAQATGAAAAAESAATSGAPLPPPIPGGAPLPSVYSADPFRSLVPDSGKATVRTAPKEGTPRTNRRLALNKMLRLPGADGVYPGSGPEGEASRPAPPPLPERPELELTGVIDAEKGGTDMALVTIDDQQRILQVGDVLPNNYRVAKIRLDGVLLVSGKDRFFVALGKKTEPAVAKPEEGAALVAPVVRS